MTTESNTVTTRAVASRSSDMAGNELQYPTRRTEGETRLRAYEIYVEHGRTDGHDVADWLQAENELAEDSCE